MIEEEHKIKSDLIEFYKTDEQYLMAEELKSKNIIRRICARRLLHSVVDKASLMKGGHKRILDAGCGDGTVSVKLIESGWSEVIGIDLSKPALNRALRSKIETKAFGVNIVQGDLNYIPTIDECFDSVICVETLEHMLDARETLLELRRVLKKEGKIVITVPNKLNPYFILRSIVEMVGKKKVPIHRTYTKRELTKLVSSSGFQVLECMFEGYFNILLTAVKTR